MKIKYRPAQTNDLRTLQKLFVETIRSTCRNDYSPEAIEAWTTSVHNTERWMSVVENQFCLIAEIDGRVAGFGSLDKGEYLDFMYVHKDFLRQGVANALFEKLKERSVQLGYQTLSSDVSITARPFFEKKGFTVIRENKNIVNGVEIINFHMSQ